MKKISTQIILSVALVCSTFLAKAGVLTIASVSPSTGAPGATITMTVTGAAGVSFSTSSTGCACTSSCMQIATGVYQSLILSSGLNTMNGISITAVNGNMFTCSFTIPSTQAAGSYAISISDVSASCIATKSAAFTVSGGASGIAAIENANFNIFPNPSKGIFDIQLNNFSTTNYADVFDLLGRKVETFNMTAEKTQVDASRFGKGVYFISIRNENGIVGRQKLVIE